MAKLQFDEMLNAGVHFGHLKRKWNPAMAPYVFEERKGIHIIDLNKTAVKAEEAAAALKQIAKSGRKILFVATKKQAKSIIEDKVKETRMPYITERWPGGMLTNFKTTRKTIRKMTSIEKMMQDGTANHLSKRERLQRTRQKDKLANVFGAIADMTRLPAAVFVVDVKKEDIAVAEAVKLGIPVFAMVDTNSDPKPIDFVIPANDDATKSIELVVDYVCGAIKEGLSERKAGKEKAAEEKATEAKKEEVTTEK
ncbi:MAG: 30S ribosomal protein S2 [Flavobacteriales bacterium]|jgi:small subunit ribosomal protein S2|nr:30S ribosomal protein S2 [Flavobacteriales bacterium]